VRAAVVCLLHLTRPIDKLKHSGLPRSGSDQTTGEGSQVFWGDTMTGLGRMTEVSANQSTGSSSSADFRLAVANPAGMAISNLCIGYSGRGFSGHFAARMACAFTAGIRGTAPPPLG
jgi:hypothetical protein